MIEVRLVLVNSWSVDDKKKLLVALQKHGTTDVAAIQKDVPNRTITEVRYILEKYSKIAYSKCQKIDKTETNASPLKQWITILKKTSSIKKTSVPDIIPRVLKYIALYEKRSENSDINLRDCYMILSDVTAGLPPRESDPKTEFFFNQCLNKLASSVKRTNIDKHRRFIQSIKNLDHLVKPQIVRTYNRKKQIDVSLNPLNVPEELLKDPKEDECSG